MVRDPVGDMNLRRRKDEERDGGHANCHDGERKKVSRCASKERPKGSVRVCQSPGCLKKKEEGGLRKG